MRLAEFLGLGARFGWKIKVTALVPCNRPDVPSAPFPEERYKEFCAQLMEKGLGWQRHPDVLGGWPAPDGREVQELCRRYVTLVDPAVADEVTGGLENFILDRFHQEAACITQEAVRTTRF
ncbi:MAG: hypothetical protein M3167_00370 [Acidobacteriota bacterium]|nr:hypothetical protein [Acidobacteriota bacterium]